MSNTTATDRRGGPVGSPSVRAAWHAARNRRVIRVIDKDDQGKKIGEHKVIKMGEGPSLKAWARQMVADGIKAAEGSAERNLGVLCDEWLSNKSKNTKVHKAPIRCRHQGQHSKHLKGSGGKVGGGGEKKKDDKKSGSSKD